MPPPGTLIDVGAYVGIGGSATNDGGAGMAQALGFRLLDAEGRELPPGGGALGRLDRIDPTGRDPALDGIEVEVACDVDNPLCGPSGASAVYGPQKGATPAMVADLDRNLDHARFELTFAGRAPTAFERARVIGPLDSQALAALLRTQDIYIAPSRDDPCSNALLEALACGLPTAYRASGGHPELVGEGGLPFREDEDLDEVLGRLVVELDERRAAIATRPISWVADRYLEVLGLRVET